MPKAPPTTTTTPAAPDQATPTASPLDQLDRHGRLMVAAYNAAWMAERLPAAMSLLRTVAAEMASAGDKDEPCESSAPYDWARQLTWVIDHVEDDTDELRKAAVAAGYTFGDLGKAAT